MDERRARYPWHACPCCVGNIPRTLLMLPTWMYAKGDNSLYVNLFVGSTVEIENVAGTSVEIVQQTDYPWSGNVTIVVSPRTPAAFSLKIRSPNRNVSELYSSTPDSNGISALYVNGSPITPDVQHGYATITRTWEAGDTVKMVLPMNIQRIKGIDKIEATRNRVALRRGPLIYTIEQVDQDPDKVLDRSAPLQTQWRGDLLHGVMTLGGSWSDGSPLLAIPYYARNNRGPQSEQPQSNRRERGAGSLSRVWMRDN